MSSGLTYSQGVFLSLTRSVECDYLDSRGLSFLIDEGSVVLRNTSEDRRRIRYEHHFDLACDIESMDVWMGFSGEGTIVSCGEGRTWTLVAESVLDPSEARTLTWAAEGFLTADFNRDGEVGAEDLSALLVDWGGEDHDLTSDGIVSSADIAVLLSQWS